MDMMDQLGVYPRFAVMGGGGTLFHCRILQGLDLCHHGEWHEFRGGQPANPAATAWSASTRTPVRLSGRTTHREQASCSANGAAHSSIEMNGRAQVIAPQGDGWIRSFERSSGN